ncbi:leucine-rich repeat-containing protein 71 isoform X2 [Phalacrocorax carbo]|uniref:leucine-rich repeat-containing protein 71 isoform X2 n=1 Tax=Phalacrocorax carbo TaxID=9209 RepID=UPI003119AE35
MRRRGERPPREKAAVAVEEEMKSTGRKAEQGAEEYQCTGLLEQDFPELCARAGIAGVPKVTLRLAPSFPADEEPAEPTLTEALARIERKYSYFQPRIQVEREHEDPRSVRAVFLRGWKIEEEMLGVLSQCLPALSGLQAVHLWKVGLTERLLPALAALATRCPCLRTLSLEGNPLPEPAFHTLMGSDSTLAHLSLRNNSIGDAAARLIGQSLSTPSSSSRSLVSLVLSFNRISDLGATYIAEGLRLNRSLLSLSLANNDIGDAGAIGLAEVLGPFALTQAEVVERRRLLLAEALEQSRTTPKETEGQSERPSNLHGSAAPDKPPPAKHGKTPARKKEPLRKEEVRQLKKPPEPRVSRSREAKPSGQEKPSLEAPDPAEPPHPLLEEARQHQGSLVLPGNRALLNLNLSHNRITERGLGPFLAALEAQQREKNPKVPGQQGLLCLSLEPGLRAAPGAAAAAGPPPQNPGPGGGAGIGALRGPRGAAREPAACLLKKNNKKSKPLPRKGRK